MVLGAGESGVGTAILGQKEGFEVFVSDRGEIAGKYRKVLEHRGIQWESGTHSEAQILRADLVMKSPGIPDSAPLVQAVRAKGIPVISEIEFASRYTGATLIGITGSNGKTTTTMMVHHLLKGEGLHVGMAGNIGDSYAKMVAERDYDHYVLELSSFQLDGIVDFRPHIALITNISPDHLDRYGYDFDRYTASKFRIAMNQGPDDYLIYDADDDTIAGWLEHSPVSSKLIPFSVKEKLSMGAWLEDRTIKIKLEHNSMEMSRDILALEGQHNVKNTMAASMAALLVKVRKETIRQSIQSFQGVPHRLEKVLKINHVEYINDSKATNVNATYYALDGIKRPIVWIAGGVDKGNEYSQLMPLVREKVKAIVCLGMDNTKLKESFGNVIPLMVETYSMEEAVKVAYKIAERGDAVLLSPACASFDLFRNYEDRGDQFKKAIKNL